MGTECTGPQEVTLGTAEEPLATECMVHAFRAETEAGNGVELEKEGAESARPVVEVSDGRTVETMELRLAAPLVGIRDAESGVPGRGRARNL